MKTTKNKLVNGFIITTFVSLYLLVSIISTIHVIDFFKLSNPEWLAISLAIGFELGAAASLASLIILDKMNKTMVWALFIVITAMQMQGNMYHSFVNLQDYQGWVELFNLLEWEPLAQKRLLAAVSGAILPLVALGFIKSLVDYIKPESTEEFTSEELDTVADEINHPAEKKTNDVSFAEAEDSSTLIAGNDLGVTSSGNEIEIDYIPEEAFTEQPPYTFETDAEVASIEETEKQAGVLEDQYEQRVVRYRGTELKDGYQDRIETVKVSPKDSNSGNNVN